MMLPRSRLLGALAGGVAIASLGACALVLGIDPPEPDPSRADGAAEDGRALDDGGVPADANDDADAADALPPCVGDGGPGIDGIFVAPPPVGSTAPNCGPKAQPCASVQLGVDRARVLQKKIVFVARGTYAEAVKLEPGITIEGAWELEGSEWVKSCVPPIHDAVVVQAPPTSDRTVTATDLQGTAGLRSLTIRSKLGAEPGESLYGLFASGASTKLVLEDVAVSVVAGGDGAPGQQGPKGADGDAGCPASTGASATTPGMDGPSASAGSFTATGYVPGTATHGATGNPGQNGTLSGPTCVHCYTCAAVTCNATQGADSCGTLGKAGCAGQGGGGGTVGQGGGASVAVYAWGAQLSIGGGALVAGAGGNGGRGGAGGPPGSGGMGTTGSVGPTCVGSCSGLIAGCNGPDVQGGGGVGGQGGSGSTGGAGGAGAGGPSFAIVSGGSAVVNLTGTSLTHGNGGISEGGGAGGASGDRWP